MAEENKAQFDYKISCYMLEIYLNKLEDLFWKLDTARKFEGKKKVFSALIFLSSFQSSVCPNTQSRKECFTFFLQSSWPEPPELRVRVDKKKKVKVENVEVLWKKLSYL